MAELYITYDQLQTSAVADESDSTDVWERLAEAVSRLCDRECEVPDGFFAPAAAVASVQIFDTDGTRYVQLRPYIAGSITSILLDGTEIYQALPANRTYHEREGYLLLKTAPEEYTPVSVTARWGFPAVPADIQQACVEQALAMWRRKDASFADISGVAGAAVTAEFTPTFEAVMRRYRGIYGQNRFFA